MVARGVQSFGILGGATDQLIEQHPKYFWPTFTERRPTFTKNFQLNNDNSKTNQDISLKFSAYVYHVSVVNWSKNFGSCSISWSVAPPSMPKLWMPLATIFVEIFFKKRFWWGSRPIWVAQWKEFQISWKKWCFEILQTTAPSRCFSGSW